jgi:hypothetical protein
MNVRYSLDAETGWPHLHVHRVEDYQVEEVLGGSRRTGGGCSRADCLTQGLRSPVVRSRVRLRVGGLQGEVRKAQKSHQ